VPEKPLAPCVRTLAGRAAWFSLPALLVLAPGCVDPSAGPTACDGLADKTLAITRADYAECAGEILGALEEFETALRRYVDGDAAAREPAASAARRLAHLMREVDFQADAWREVKGGSARTIERWPDAAMRDFNGEVINAAAQLNAVLHYPNQDNLQQGASRHAQARSAYSRFR